MSKIGKKPILIPENVSTTIGDGLILIKGPKGELSVPFKPEIEVSLESNEIKVSRKNEIKKTKAQHGTIRSLIQNAVNGVTNGYSKTLKLIGTGYRAAMQGKNLNISLGFSHPVIINAVDGIEFKVNEQDTIIVSGINKELVGQISADIRAKRPPEPYKGKGIRYENEYVPKKAGKAAKSE